MHDADADVDGRRLRRAENRRAVVEALASLYQEGNLDPSAADIAERAGLSPRSLFRYFDDVDDLARAAIELHQERAAPFVDIPAQADDDLGRRVDAIVRARSALWERVGPGARVTRLRAWRHPLLATQLRRGRARLRAQVRRLFAPELGAMAPEQAASTLAAIDVLCSFEAWELLRFDQRLTAPRAEAALRAALHRLLPPEPNVG